MKTSGSTYTPPQSYWREIRKVDEAIHHLSEPGVGTFLTISALGRTVTRGYGGKRAALWVSGDAHMALWSKAEFGPTHSFGSRVSVTELPNISAVQEGSVSCSGLATTYKYNWLTRRPIGATHDIIPELRDPASYPNPAESQSFDPLVTKDEYEQLLEHLRVGASGDYQTPLIAPDHLREG